MSRYLAILSSDRFRRRECSFMRSGKASTCSYPKLIHCRLPKGGHFAAWAQPKFLSEEMRAGFRSLRK